MAYDSTIEDMIESFRAFVADNIGTYVTGINDAKADGVTLPAFVAVETSDPSPYSLDQYPVIQIDPQQLAAEHLAMGFDELSAQLRMVIAIEQQDDRKTATLRYTEAVRQLLRDYDKGTFGDEGFDLDPEDPVMIQYFTKATDRGVAVAVVELTIRDEVAH